MRLIDKALHPFRQPMVAARLLQTGIHALLHDGPRAVIGDNESMKIKIVPVLDGIAIDFGDEAACLRQGGAVETHALPDGDKFLRGGPRMLAPSAADMDAQFLLQR